MLYKNEKLIVYNILSILKYALIVFYQSIILVHSVVEVKGEIVIVSIVSLSVLVVVPVVSPVVV